MGKGDKALAVLTEALGHSNVRVGLHAANALDHLDEKARDAVDAMKKAKGDGYTQRTLGWALQGLGEKKAPSAKKPRRKKK